MAIDSKRIAKNTVFLYARLLLVLGVTLYTSRVVLDKLGVDDYGLYNVVFGVIGLLSFLNGTLSFGTSRFITFELGKKDMGRLKATFRTALGAHAFLAGLIILLGETVGIWYVYHVMVCPPERFGAALIVYQFSILSTVLSILQVPFSSAVLAHEKMDFYAYLGVFEAVGKLVVAFLLFKTPFDRLVYYAALMALVSVGTFAICAFYCKAKFEEVSFKIAIERSIFFSILKFSGWNIIANISNTLMSQGVIMLFNIFFQPFVVAAQAISNQISSALMQFVNNVRQAVNPQVIKLYAEGNYADSKRLTLSSAEYIFDLLLLFGVPLIMAMPAILDIWLVEVPQYTVEFARLIVVQDILGNFSAAFYTPMVAANKIEKNSIAALFLCVIQFSALYILFKIGLSPLWARYVGILFVIIWSFVVKPYILWKDIDYSWKEMWTCIGRCMRVLVLVVALCSVMYLLLPQTSLGRSVLVAFLSFTIVGAVSFAFMEKSIKYRLINYIRSRV